MEPNVLRDHLTKLHAELGAARAVDPDSSALLGEIMADIKRLLAEPREAGAVESDMPATGGTAAAGTSLPDRLERIAVQFEAAHPTLAASSRRLVDLLGKAGV